MPRIPYWFQQLYFIFHNKEVNKTESITEGTMVEYCMHLHINTVSFFVDSDQKMVSLHLAVSYTKILTPRSWSILYVESFVFYINAIIFV